MKRMMPALMIIAVAATGCGAIASNVVQGSGNVVVETYEVSGFDQVELATIGELYIEQGETASLSIETDDNILPLLIVEDEGGKLTLGDKGGLDLQPSAGITFRVTVKDLQAVTGNSSGRIFVGPITGETLEVDVRGSGDVTMESVEVGLFSVDGQGSGDLGVEGIKAKAIDVRADASGAVEIAGTTDSYRVELSGSGRVATGDLTAEKVVMVVTGSGEATVHAVDSLDVTISSSGNAQYYGNPTVTQNITGSGTLKALGSK